MRLVAYHFTADAPTNISEFTHIRFGALMVADAVVPSAVDAVVPSAVDAPSMGHQQKDRGTGKTLATLTADVAAAATTAVTSKAKTEWTTTAAYQGHHLAVVRNLTCSEVAGLVENQTIHTRWNCLVSRHVNGSTVTPGPLTVNGKVVASL